MYGLFPGWQLKQIITAGFRPIISQSHGLCTHNCTCNLDELKHNMDYVSRNLQLSTIEEGWKSFRREAGEKSGRELRLELTNQDNLYYIQIWVDYIQL